MVGMRNLCFLLMVGCMILSCHRKTAPQTVAPENIPAKKTAPLREEKKRPIPKTIIVNDRAATQTPDGRFYYDLNGKRYWKNFKDGKYHLYRKGINADPDFSPSTSSLNQ